MNNYFAMLFEQIAKVFKWWVVILPWEQGLRIRLGKHERVLSAGTYFRIPYFDTVVVRSTRMRAVSLTIQTVQTKDNKTVSFLCSCGYAITDIRKMYRTIYHPDATIGSMVMSYAAEYIATNNITDITPEKMEAHVREAMNAESYGIGQFYARIIGYASVTTFRMIQDSSWVPLDRSEDEKEAVR